MCPLTTLRARPGPAAAAGSGSDPLLPPGARLLLSGRPGVPGCCDVDVAVAVAPVQTAVICSVYHAAHVVTLHIAVKPISNKSLATGDQVVDLKAWVLTTLCPKIQPQR